MVGGLNFTFAPPSKLVTSFFVLGAIFYLISSLIFWELDILNLYHLEPKAVGFAHIFLVGFVMSVIFGAMYQLISVVLEIPLFSDELAFAHLGLFIVGISSFISSFIFDGAFNYLGYGAVILYISFLLYIINILFSIKEVKKRDIKFYMIFLAHILLFLGATYGLLATFGLVHSDLVINTSYFIGGHIPLVIFGFMMSLIAIIATVLLPMFMLSHNFNKDISNYILRAIIFGTIFAIFGWSLLTKIAYMVALGLLAYQLYDIIQKRLRKTIDVYALDMYASVGFLAGVLILLPFISNERVLKFVVVFGLFGFLSSFVVGHIYKIVPFLVWNEKFAPLVGKQKVPMLADMVHERGSKIEFYLKVATIVALLIGLGFGSSFFISVAKVLFLLNGIAVIANIIYIFRYKG